MSILDSGLDVLSTVNPIAAVVRAATRGHEENGEAPAPPPPSRQDQSDHDLLITLLERTNNALRTGTYQPYPGNQPYPVQPARYATGPGSGSIGLNPTDYDMLAKILERSHDHLSS